MGLLGKLLTLLLTALVGILLLFLLDRYQVSNWRETRRLQLAKEADLISVRLENALNSRIDAARHLGAAVEASEAFSKEHFERFAASLMEYNPSLRALQLTDKSTQVIFVYPPRGNEVTITEPMVLLQDPLRGSYVRKAMEERRLTVQPPFELRQGGLGIVARNPIFVSGQFRGLATADLDVPAIIDEAFPTPYRSDYRLRVSDSHGRRFYGSIPETAPTAERTVHFADSRWTVVLASTVETVQPPLVLRLDVYGLGGTALAFILLIIWLLQNRADQLKRQVTQRTAELENSERRFRIVADFTADWEYWITPEGNLEYISPSVKELTGYGPEEFRTGADILKKLVHGEDRQKMERHLSVGEGILETAREQVTFRIRTKDGTERWIGHLCRAVFDSEGAFLGRRASNRDITEEKVLAENLEQTVEAKELLMKELNHRVKNNLAMVTSLVHLKAGSLGESVDLSDIIHQVDTIRILHEKLYQNSAVNRIDMSEYVSDVLSSLFSFSEVPVEVDNGIRVTEMSTRTAIPLGLIVNEVATNALKYSFNSTEPAHFGVAIDRDEDSGEFVVVLSHSGAPFPDGIDLDNPGTLGLRLIAALVGQLNGTVALQRKPSPRFTVRFPTERDRL